MEYIWEVLMAAPKITAHLEERRRGRCSHGYGVASTRGHTHRALVWMPEGTAGTRRAALGSWRLGRVAGTFLVGELGPSCSRVPSTGSLQSLGPHRAAPAPSASAASAAGSGAWELQRRACMRHWFCAHTLSLRRNKNSRSSFLRRLVLAPPDSREVSFSSPFLCSPGTGSKA